MSSSPLSEDAAVTEMVAKLEANIKIDSQQIEADPTYIVIDNITEQTSAFHIISTNPLAPMSEVGDSGVYYDNIFSESKEIIGHTVGYIRAIAKDPADGHLITQFEEIVELEDGIIRAYGPFDRSTLLSGACVRLTVEGLSGKYAGMGGFREWQIIPPLAEATVRVRMVLCG
jgi:hypothetical protein